MYGKQELWTTQFPVPPPPPPPHRPEAKELNSDLLSETNPRVDLGGGCGCEAHQEKALLLLFLNVSVDPLLDNLEPGKINFRFGKKVWKKS